MNAIVYRLTRIHRRLQDAIDRESQGGAPNAVRLLRLRTFRLIIKDRLSRLQRQTFRA